LAKNGWSKDEVDLFIPHQANARIVQAIADNLKLPFERFFVNIHKYGNTTAASIPICLAEAQREGKINEGDKIIVVAFGSGFTWASAAICW
ncbi:MAG: 3-oxoacyl-ACP synthase, partial [Bacteroidia bacterium]|nr:3-oxoacyl-ACP synthase [Bacteroidia bacterium]